MADGPERTTVLLVTHDQRVIDHADRIVNMVGGRIVTNSLTRIAVRICRALASSETLKGLSEATLSRLAILGDERLELEVAQLQQFDCLGQLGRQHQRLGLANA